MILALDAIQVILVYVVTGHNVIVEATKASGEIMATQMHDMAAASRDLERSKIEVQLKLFAEQMAYQRENDRCLYENAVIANKNAPPCNPETRRSGELLITTLKCYKFGVESVIK
jgi:hypothetical protein